MNRLNERSKILSRRLPPRVMVISGAALGLVAGVAVFGAVSSSSVTASPPAFKPALVSAATPHAAPAPCAKGQKLEHGVCIVHVVRTVVVPAAGSGSSSGSGSTSGSAPSGSGEHSTEPGEDESATEPKGEDESTESANEAAHEAAEHAKEAAASDN